jgi:hypothetical protein
MEESNKPQDPQNPSFGQPNDVPQNDPQNDPQNNKESTYWETNSSVPNPDTAGGQNQDQQPNQYIGQPQQTAAGEPFSGADPAQQTQQIQQIQAQQKLRNRLQQLQKSELVSQCRQNHWSVGTETVLT